MTNRTQLIQALQTNSQGTPYVIAPTDKGFTISLNIADANWYTLFYKNGVKRTFTIDADMDEANHVVRTTDTLYALDWRAGTGADDFVPRLGGKINVQKGEVINFQSRKEFGIRQDGTVGQAVNYTFSSSEAKQWLDAQLQANGWKRGLGATAKHALVFAVIVGIVTAVMVPVALILKSR